MPYPVTGPFTNGTAPGISAAFLNNVETWLGTALQADGDVAGTANQSITFASIGGSDLNAWTSKVTGDTGIRIGTYIRHTDNYGGLLGGLGSTPTAHLYAQAAGWRITESLTIDTNLTVTTNGTITGTLGVTGLLTASAGVALTTGKVTRQSLFTGTGPTSSQAHGLGTTPDIVIVMPNSSSVQSWAVNSIGATTCNIVVPAAIAWTAIALKF